MNYACVRRFTEKLNRLTVSDYHGLVSPGLTCYLNSVLHVLFMTKGFRDSIKRSSSHNQTKMDTLLRDLFSALERGSAETRSITVKLGITDVYEQRDTAEYFEKIMCLTSVEASKMFKGELTHKTTCNQCRSSSDSRSFFWILPLSMENSGSRTYSVKQGLKAFFRRETVQGENQMYCDCCFTKRDTHIECKMTQQPEVLTLLLKRFTYNCILRRYEKLLCHVKVPPTLHIQHCDYELYALIHHFGSLSGGHYTAEIKSFENGDWYCFNDNAVDRVKEQLFGSGGSSLRSQSAYLLMYKRVSSYSEKDQCAGSDVVAEGRYEENAEPMWTPSSEEKLLIGESSSLELENRPHPSVKSQARPHTGTDGGMRFTAKSTLSSMDKDGESYRPVPPTHLEDFPADLLQSLFENSWNKTQTQNDIARNGRARTETRFVSDGYQNESGTVAEMRKEDNVQKQGREAGLGSSNSISLSPHPPRRLHSNRHTDALPCTRPRSSSIRRNCVYHLTEALQVVAAGSERRKKKTENGTEERVKRPAWK